MTTTGKRQRYPTSDNDNDNGEALNSNPQLTDKRRVSAAGDFASHRFIVSERQQLAVLKQLTASDESNPGLSSSSILQQQRPTKIHRRNEHGETIVHIAARKGDLKQLKKALKDGASVNEEDNAGWTPLHEAVTKNQYTAARLLLKSGANSNAPGPEGQTPLIDAVLNNNIKMVGLLLNYSADPSGIDSTRINETMVKILKGETPTFTLSDDENDDESLSPSSLISSADDSEHDDDDKMHKNLSSSSFPKTQRKKSFHHFREHSSDSSLNHSKNFTIENDLTRKNPYDFESGDDTDDLRQQTISTASNDSNDIKKEHSISDDEHTRHMYRVPPIKIILARAVLQKPTDTESINSSNMDENSTTESSSLPIIEQNEKFLSTVVTSIEFNNKVMALEEEREKNEENRSSLLNIDEDQMIISTIINNLLTQIDFHITSTEEQQDIRKKEKQNDLKPTTRTLRSHARGKLNLLISNQTNQRISHRKRVSEKSQHETSSNSDDQTIENLHMTNHEDTNIAIDDGSNSNTSTGNIKSIHNHSDTDTLPPNKHRLRERNIAILDSSSTEENIPMETTTKDIPINGIKQFLEIRQQIHKRHETMLHDFVLPKVPKDFAETLMAKKNYLIAPSYKTFSITTPASIGIRRFNPPSDLDSHLSDIFTRQEDERYRLKLRHQVEREKLILSHEQEVLRLYGNATRQSTNQEIPFSYCSLMKDNEVYNNSSMQERTSAFINNDYPNTELGKRGKHRWNGRSFIKWLEDSNLKYKRLSCEINQRQYLESNTLYSMQKMVWLKHLPKETSSIGRINSFLSERYLPKVDINTNFWTHWQPNTV